MYMIVKIINCGKSILWNYDDDEFC